MLSIYASELSRVMQCAGYPALKYNCKDHVPNLYREDADKGTERHAKLERAYKDGGVKTEDHLVNAVLLCLPRSEALRLEEKIYSGVLGSYIRADAWWTDGLTLRVWDFKYGRWIVEPERNWQLIAAAVELLKKPECAGVTEVDLRIIQPTVDYHPRGIDRSWKPTGEQLRAAAEEIKLRVHEAHGVAPTFTTGPECLFCPVRHQCTTHINAGSHAMEVSKRLPDPSGMTIDKMAVEYQEIIEAEEIIKGRKTALEACLISALETGKPVPHWTMSQRRGPRQWKPGATKETVSAAASLYGVDVTDSTLVTPAEAERRGLPDTALKLMTTQPYQRPQLKRINAKEVFKQ